MRVLSLNCGSSSLRWGLFDVSSERELAVGAFEEVHDPAGAWQQARESLKPLEPEAVGHRVVHGGERFTASALIDDAVIRAIEEQVPLAPAHNPRSLLGIREAQRIFPEVPHVAVFDTAFHQSMPPEAYLYALPYALYERDRIRRYGFHGISHRHAAERAAVLLGKPAEAFTGITCHLGNGCSIAAVERGRSVDTSMGMTPLEGLMMGTRSGDVDPAVVLDLAARPDLDPEGVKAMLNEDSGLLGVSGVSSDLREVEDAAATGNERASLALNLFAHRVRRGIGSALAILGGADAVAFTGGIGERASLALNLFAHRVRRGIGSALAVLGGADAVTFTGGIGERGVAMRERISQRLSGLGLELDAGANRACVDREGRISTLDSPIVLFVIPAREEWLIARETVATLS